MTALTLDVSGDSWLYRLDPRVKLLFVLEATILLFVWPTLPVALAVELVLAVMQAGPGDGLHLPRPTQPWRDLGTIWHTFLLCGSF